MSLSNISFAIATVETYKETTIPVVINSLRLNDISSEQIHVFVNSSTKNSDEIVDGINYHYNVGLSYFEWINPKLIIERNLKSDWWFLLHDTVEFGLRTQTVLKTFAAISDTNCGIIKLTPTHSNSIGMLRQRIFDTHQNFFFDKLRSLDTIHDVLERKRWCIKNENSFLHLEPFSFFQSDNAIQVPNQSIYDTKRIREYFHGIDMIKWKKNNSGYAAVRDVQL